MKANCRLTSRDIALLVALFRYRYLSAEQVQRLLFPSQQTANRRLRALSASGHLRAIAVPGIAGRIVALARPGAELVAAHLGVPTASVTYPSGANAARDHYFLRHFHAVTDFRFALEKDCSESGTHRLAGFLPEFLTRTVAGGRIEKYLRDVIVTGGGHADTVSHTPDGVFALERDGRTALFFLEIDRGTEVVGRAEKGVLKAMRFYLGYLKSGGYQRYREDLNIEAPFSAFRLLFVTTSKARIENVRAASATLDDGRDGARRFLWLAEENAVRTRGVLGAPWVSLDPADTSVYVLGSTGVERT